jgi:hypothetical protein
LIGPRRCPRFRVHAGSAACLSAIFVVVGCVDDRDESEADISFPAGTYRMHLAADEPRPGCVNGDLDIELVIDDTTLSRSRFIGGQPGTARPFTYSVFRDQITIRDDTRTLTATWAFDGESLTISHLGGGRCEDVSDWTAAPFVLGGDPAQGTP